jgi:hypothetical protein
MTALKRTASGGAAYNSLPRGSARPARIAARSSPSNSLVSALVEPTSAMAGTSSTWPYDISPSS